MPISDKNYSFLRQYYKEEFLVYFRYFVEGYFVPGYGYDELPRLIKEFREKEPSSSSEGLARELILIKESGDWDYIQQFVRKHGMRLLNHEKLEKMVDMLIESLSS
ncbi:MAG: hypothetical protein APF77_22510 [Clostridia bacterium BRH_c25]|nr:MAG: hypothetical protein APF77_22510 [Clostridia bacterium BRH_c25]